MDVWEFEASLVYIQSSRQTGLHSETFFKKINNNRKRTHHHNKNHSSPTPTKTKQGTREMTRTRVPLL